MFRVLHSMDSINKGMLPVCLCIQANSMEKKAVELSWTGSKTYVFKNYQSCKKNLIK